MMLPRSACQICGHGGFVHSDVLWPELIRAWECSPTKWSSSTSSKARAAKGAAGTCGRRHWRVCCCWLWAGNPWKPLPNARASLPREAHGTPDCGDPDFLVHTEYGSDVWTDVLRAGFDSCELVDYRFPAGIAVIARRV